VRFLGVLRRLAPSFFLGACFSPALYDTPPTSVFSLVPACSAFWRWLVQVVFFCGTSFEVFFFGRTRLWGRRRPGLLNLFPPSWSFFLFCWRPQVLVTKFLFFFFSFCVFFLPVRANWLCFSAAPRSSITKPFDPFS